MGSRSLFSPFASSINPGAVRNIKNLFAGPDNIEINPEYLELLKAGVEPPPEMLMTTPLYKGGRSAKLANAKFLSDLVQAQFGSNLAASKEKELIPFRSAQEVEQAKTLSQFARKQKQEIEDEELSNIGTARGQVLGSLPTKQLSNIIPQGTTFQNPAEQERFYQQRVGSNIPVNKAIVETDPNVTKGRIGEEASKRFIHLGGDYLYDTITGEFVQGGGYQSKSVIEMVETGEPVAKYNEAGEYIGMGKKLVPKTTTSQEYKRGFRGNVPKVSQKALDDIPKESGAEEDIGVNNISKPIGNFLMPGSNTNAGKKLSSLPLDTTLKQPVLAKPGFFGLLKNFAEEKLGPGQLIKKKEVEQKSKEKPKSYPLDHLIRAYKLDKEQTEMFEFFVQKYTKNEGRYPSLGEARAYLESLFNKK